MDALCFNALALDIVYFISMRYNIIRSEKCMFASVESNLLREIIKMKKKLLIILVILFSLITLFAVEKDAIVGLWFMQEYEGDRGIAEVFEHNGKYYAVAIAYESYISVPLNTILISRDVNNPDVSLRNRPQNEVVFIAELSFNGKKWEDGEIYDPATGKYGYVSSKLKDDNLVLRLSLDRLGVFGANTTWTRVENIAGYDLFRKPVAELKALVPNKRVK